MGDVDIIKCALHYEYFCESFFDYNGIDGDARGEQNYMGNEQDMVALLCWKILFHSNQTFMVAVPNGRLADHWHTLVNKALYSLPERMTRHLTSSRHLITSANGSRMMFEVVSRNTGRGQTITGMYLIESQLVNSTTYEQFWHSAMPTFYAAKTQIVHYTRGY